MKLLFHILVKKIKKFVKVILLLGFYLLNPLVRIFIRFEYIFFTYAGSKKDIKGYGPNFLTYFLPPVFPLGYLSSGESIGYGLMLGTPKRASDFDDPKNMKNMLRYLKRWRRRTGARAIALGGQLPGIMVHNNVPVEPPLVKSIFGTVFILSQVINEVVRKHKMDTSASTIGVLGIGFIGAPLATFLAGQFRRVIAIDRVINESLAFDEKTILYSTDHQLLEDCDIIVLLTGKGDDAASKFDQIKKGAIVVDDSHPQLSPAYIRQIIEERQGTVYKAAVGLSGVRYVPRLPGFKPEWIPGCAVEAMVASRYGFVYNSQDDFNRLGKDLGFYPLLVNHTMDQ